MELLSSRMVGQVSAQTGKIARKTSKSIRAGVARSQTRTTTIRSIRPSIRLKRWKTVPVQTSVIGKTRGSRMVVVEEAPEVQFEEMSARLDPRTTTLPTWTTWTTRSSWLKTGAAASAWKRSIGRTKPAFAKCRESSGARHYLPTVASTVAAPAVTPSTWESKSA